MGRLLRFFQGGYTADYLVNLPLEELYGIGQDALTIYNEEKKEMEKNK